MNCAAPTATGLRSYNGSSIYSYCHGHFIWLALCSYIANAFSESDSTGFLASYNLSHSSTHV